MVYLLLGDPNTKMEPPAWAACKSSVCKSGKPSAARLDTHMPKNAGRPASPRAMVVSVRHNSILSNTSRPAYQAATLPPEVPRQPFVDVFRFNDELDMLEYRLRLMSPIVDTFAVVECDVTDSGAPKMLHAHQLLMSRAGSIAPSRALHLNLPGGEATGLITEVVLREPAAKVVLLNLSVRSIDVARHFKHTLAFSRELVIRKFMTFFVGRSFPQSRVLVADVDELLDPGLGAASFQQHSSCIRPRLRHYWFGEHCVKVTPAGKTSKGWTQPLIVDTGSPWFGRIRRELVILRHEWGTENHYKDCWAPPAMMGWHFSYAMDTNRVMQKLKGFSHSDDMQVRKFVNGTAAQVRRRIEERVGTCTHFFATTVHPGLAYRRTPYDGQLPALKGWPRHPLAPTFDYAFQNRSK